VFIKIAEKALPPLVKLLDKLLLPALDIMVDMLTNYGLPILEKLGDVFVTLADIIANVLVGHSERRTIWKETDAETAQKTAAVIEAGMKAIVCIGETLAEREADQTMSVCVRQLTAVADALKPEHWAHVVVAYEPVWAIGTGKVATKEQAQEVHAKLRAFIAEKVGKDVASALRIVYGGSVTAASAPSLIAEADIDGFLVGGASLKPEFVQIVLSAATKA
jgi:triosephosphate isomerase